MTHPTRTTSAGPLYCAIASAMIPAIQLIALFTGLKINMTTVLAIIIPDVTLSTLLLAVSMGWIFVLIGRLHRKPAKLGATTLVLGVTMIELMAIIVIAGRAGNGS